MSKPFQLVLNGQVGEDLSSFTELLPEQVELARKFFLGMSGSVEPEAREIWRLASKFMISGDAVIETPAGPQHGTLVGFFITNARDPKEDEKLKEMLDRAIAIQGKKPKGD